MITLFELCGANPKLVFSPYCWRVRLALAHKQLNFKSQPVRFTDKDLLSESGQKLVPVICDRDLIINDSLEIFEYLDKMYPKGILLGNSKATNQSKLSSHLIVGSMGSSLAKILLLDIYQHIDEADKNYFRESREQSIGTTLEEFSDPSGGKESFIQALKPMEQWLEKNAFLEGNEAGGTDYLVAGFFFWAWCFNQKPWEGLPETTRWFEALKASYEVQCGPVVHI